MVNNHTYSFAIWLGNDYTRIADLNRKLANKLEHARDVPEGNVAIAMHVIKRHCDNCMLTWRAPIFKSSGEWASLDWRYIAIDYLARWFSHRQLPPEANE